MPASRILGPIKAAFKREDDNAVETPYGPPVVKDYAGVAGSLESVSPQPSDGTSSWNATTAENHPQSPQNTTTAQASINPFDARADVTSSRIVERAETQETKGENGLNETQLRRLYDDEEIERFLTVFGTHISEITLPTSTQSEQPRKFRVLRSNFADGLPEDIKFVPVEEGGDSDAETDVGEPWTYLSQEVSSTLGTPTSTSGPSEPSELVHTPTPRYLSARVAALLISKLPPNPAIPTSEYRPRDAQLAGQRIYLSTYPYYAPLITDLMRLAAWSDWYRSARICMAWWVCWWLNSLLPAFLSLMLLSLLHQGTMKSRTLDDLRRRRRSAQETDELGDAMEGYGAGVSFFGTGSAPGVGLGGGDVGFKDLWELTKIFVKGKGKKEEQKVKQATSTTSDVGDNEVNNAREKGDWRKPMVKAMEDFADLNERVRNIFIWRRRRSSQVYALVLALLILFATLVPAQIIAKISYAAIGLFYWFGIPVILAMPPDTFKRLPRPFADAPSDAEYAIGLINTRLAHGESVLPTARRAQRQPSRVRHQTAGLNPTASEGDVTGGRTSWIPKPGHTQAVEDMRREADEKEIIAVGERGVTSREKDLTTEDVDVGDDMQPNMDKKDDSEKLQHAIGASQTVPASHKGTPGSLTLSSEAITFTSLLANISRLAVPLEQIQGVKKTRHTGGLRVHYRDDEQMERELVFRLVSNRDEMFGKLVGWGGKR